MKEINLNIVRGDTTRIGITLNNAESAPEQIIFSVKSSFNTEQVGAEMLLPDKWR